MIIEQNIKCIRKRIFHFLTFWEMSVKYSDYPLSFFTIMKPNNLNILENYLEKNLIFYRQIFFYYKALA